MSAKTFKSNLSVKGLNELKKQIRSYQQVTLKNNLEEFLNQLTDAGINVAYQNTGDFKQFIGFTKQVDATKYNYKFTGILIGSNVATNISRWISYDGVTEKEVNSLMMAEYGSGQFALAYHRGTFPDQTHAFEDSWWYATDIGADGRPTNWHRSEGVKPTMPMYRAWYEMRMDIVTIARRVFG